MITADRTKRLPRRGDFERAVQMYVPRECQSWKSRCVRTRSKAADIRIACICVVQGGLPSDTFLDPVTLAALPLKPHQSRLSSGSR